MSASHLLEDFFSKSKIPSIINISTLVHRLVLDGPQRETFQKVPGLVLGLFRRSSLK